MPGLVSTAVVSQRSRSRQRNLQNRIHLVQRSSLGFWEEEERPEGRQHHPRGEKEPGSVPEAVEDIGKRLGDDELD